jgi:hypothetical protein
MQKSKKNTFQFDITPIDPVRKKQIKDGLDKDVGYHQSAWFEKLKEITKERKNDG